MKSKKKKLNENKNNEYVNYLQGQEKQLHSVLLWIFVHKFYSNMLGMRQYRKIHWQKKIPHK